MSASPDLQGVADTVAAARPISLRGVGQLLRSDLAPLVRRIDEGHYPEAVLRRLGEAGAFLGYRERPTQLFDAIAAMARVGEECLATAFCMWCQDTFAWYLQNTDNEE